jgi:hypothetical protein
LSSSAASRARNPPHARTQCRSTRRNRDHGTGGRPNTTQTRPAAAITSSSSASGSVSSSPPVPTPGAALESGNGIAGCPAGASGDAAGLARNWLDAARHYAELDAGAFQVPAADGLVAWFEELLGRPRPDDAVWLVAEVDGRVVGDAVARLEPPVEDAPRQLLRDLGRVRLQVDALGVAEAYRRRGAPS